MARGASAIGSRDAFKRYGSRTVDDVDGDVTRGATVRERRSECAAQVCNVEEHIAPALFPPFQKDRQPLAHRDTRGLAERVKMDEPFFRTSNEN